MKLLRPISRMLERIEIEKEDSDLSYFFSLMLFGEMLLKLITCGLLALCEEDPARQRYRIEHRLVRTNGLGDWSDAIEELTTGPASHNLHKDSTSIAAEIALKVESQAWQYKTVSLLHGCLNRLNLPILNTQRCDIALNLI